MKLANSANIINVDVDIEKTTVSDSFSYGENKETDAK